MREDRAAADFTMGSLLDLINAAKVLLAPFLPHTSAQLHRLLGYDDALEDHGWTFEPLPARPTAARRRRRCSASWSYPPPKPA